MLGASGRPDLRHDSVAEPLEANIIVLGPAPDPTVLVGLDALYPGEVRRKLDVLTGLAPERLFVAASHTHRAPMTDSTKPLLGGWEEEYTTDLALRINAQIERLRGTAGRLAGAAWSELPTAFTVSRRRRVPFRPKGPKRWGSFVIGPNIAGTVDDQVRVIVLRRHDAIQAVIWSLACHPVGHFAPSTVAAHFPGVVRHEIRRRLGNESLPVVFLQGFSGDTRPAATAPPPRWPSLLDVVAPRRFEDMSTGGYRRWTSELALATLNAVESATAVDVYSKPATRRITRPSDGFVSGRDGDVTFQRIDLGPKLRLVGASAEVVAGYRGRVAALSPQSHLITCGCLDDTFGYAPTAAQIKEGGYEAGAFCRTFSLEGVNPRIEHNMMSGFADVSADTPNVDGGAG